MDMKVDTAKQSIAEQAAEWVLSLRECSPNQIDAYQRRFESWKQADLRHANAAKRVEKFLGYVTVANDDNDKSARKALENGLNARSKRVHQQLLNKTLSILLIAALPLLLLHQFYPIYYFTSDHVAAAGEWQTHTLSDGSQITLAGKTAIDIDFDANTRLLSLINGEVYIDVAADKHRPFIVRTDFGDIEALGTQFLVNHSDNVISRVAMIESRVKISHSVENTFAAEQELTAGEQISLDATGLGQIQHFDVGLYQKRWHNRQLLVQARRLDEVLQELKRFHNGYIHFDAEELASINVSAVLPLDNTNNALDLIASSFDSIRIRQYSPWLTVVERVE